MSSQNLKLLNCGGEHDDLGVECPMNWDALERTESLHQRFCTSCQQRVTLCVSAQEARIRTDENECIAVPEWLVEGDV